MPKGKILFTEDHGTIWRLWYEIDGNGIQVVSFDHRPFAQFYEGVTGRSFYKDYNFGQGRDSITKRLKDTRISVSDDRRHVDRIEE